MMKIRIRAAWWQTLGFLIAANSCIVPVAAVQKADVVLETILSDWTRRQRMIASVSCEVDGQVIVMRGSRTWIAEADFPNQHIPPLPDADHSYRAHRIYYFDFRKGRARKETDWEMLVWNTAAPTFTGARFRPMFEIDVFDGRYSQKLRPRNKNERTGVLPGTPFLIELIQQTDASRASFFVNSDYPILFAFALIPVDGPLRPDRMLLSELARSRLRLHGFAPINGQDHAVFQTPSLTPDGTTYQEYWVDPNRDSIISRWSDFSHGREVYRIELVHEIQHGFWLPANSTMTRFADNGEPAQLQVLSHSYPSLNAVLQDSLFHFDEESGMIVQDNRDHTLVQVGRPGESPVDLRAGVSPRRAHLAVWLLAVAIVGTGFLVSGLLWKTRCRH